MTFQVDECKLINLINLTLSVAQDWIKAIDIKITYSY